jgi:hypothetical protein
MPGDMVSATARVVPDTRPRAWWAAWRSSVITALVAVSAFRVATLLIAVLVAHGRTGWDLLQPWNQFDTPWWDSIARNGYGVLHHDVYSDGAFAPAYPMAMRAVMWLVHAGALGAGFLVSSASLYVAAAVVHRLIEEDHGTAAARTGVLLMLLWPTAVFLAAPYSESLSLALVALALLAARRERWWWAGILAALAMLSKYVLGLLVVALVIDHVVRRRRRGERPSVAALAALTLPGAAALTGVLLFMHARFGDPFFFLSAEGAAWGHRLTTPVRLFVNARRELAAAAQVGAASQLRAFAMDDVTILGLAALAAAMLVKVRRHVAEVALVTLIAATFLCMSGPDSVGRYALTVAPIFVVLGPALARRPRVRLVALTCSGAVMLLQLFTFASAGWAG